MKLTLTDLTVQRLKAPEKGQTTVWDTIIRGFGIRLSQGGSRSWIVVKGKARKLTTLGRYPTLTLKDARNRARSLLASQTTESTTPAPTTFLEAISRFLEAKKKTTRPNTYKQYSVYVKVFDFDKKLHAVTRQDIYDAIAHLDGKPYAQNCALTVAQVFFNWCVTEELVSQNPVQKATAPNKVHSRARVLSDDELVAIWKATDFKPYGHIIRVLMLTGQRVMEVAGIRDELHFPITKNHHPHTLPTTPLVSEHLPIEPFSNWTRAKKKLDEACGVKDWVLHDLRRTFSTNCARHGVPLHITELILNHRKGSMSSIALVYNRYSFAKEIEEALLTHENFIRTLVTAKA